MEKNLDLKYFLEIEEKYNLYMDRIEGIEYWIYSRFFIWEEIILKDSMGLKKAHNAKALTIPEAAGIFLGLLKKSIVNPAIRKKNIDVLLVSHPRRVLKDGAYECIYTDEVAKGLDNYAVLEQPYNWRHLEPLSSSHVIYADYILLKKGLYYAVNKFILRGKYKKLLNKIEEKIKQPLEEMENIYSIVLDKKRVLEAIAMQILFYKGSVRSLEALLTRLNPRAVVEVISYNPMCMLINEICKKKKIPTIELQHGRLDSHVGYAYMRGEEIRQLPDKLYLFSRYWKKKVHMPVSEENLEVTGYPYFDRKKKEARAIEKYMDGRINIIFISQGTIGDKLSEFASRLSDSLDPAEYRIFYKLHPGEFAIWEKSYTSLKKSNIIVIGESEYSLYDFFATCRIQVGVYSTALYEGLGFHLDTYIYQIELSDHMESLAKAGYVKYVKNEQQLCHEIEGKSSSNKAGGEFWEPHSKENITSNIKKLVSAQKEN